MKTNFGARLLALTALIAMPIMLAHPLTARGASVADDMFFGGKVEATGAFKAKSTAEILGASTLHAVTATTVTTVGFIQTGASTRTGQVFTFTTAKAGATAGWAEGSGV